MPKGRKSKSTAKPASKAQQPRPAPRASGLSKLLALRGMGKDLWRDEDPDRYVAALRDNWS
jgi:hypothetical protein